MDMGWYNFNPKDTVRVYEDKHFVVDYNKEGKMYRVSVFEDDHFKDEYWFDAYEDKELSSIEKHMYDYASAYVKGAADFMKYMQNYYNYIDDTVPVYPNEMEGILKEFLQQFGEVREVNK